MARNKNFISFHLLFFDILKQFFQYSLQKISNFEIVKFIFFQNFTFHHQKFIFRMTNSFKSCVVYQNLIYVKSTSSIEKSISMLSVFPRFRHVFYLFYIFFSLMPWMVCEKWPHSVSNQNILSSKIAD